MDDRAPSAPRRWNVEVERIRWLPRLSDEAARKVLPRP